MRLMLVGADCEENLGMCMVSAGAAAHGHKVQVMPFDHASQTDAVVRCVVDRNPGCVGLAMQFQHRGHEFLTLAARLRKAGYKGHITCGGQFPSMAFREVLEGGYGVDSAVIHEADHCIGELLDAIEARTPLDQVAGIALLGADGKAVRTADRRLIPDLDTLQIARRYRAHSRHFGIPFIPMWGSRGCWGRCTYCSISTCYRDARAHGGGNTLRLRSPKNLATEMAVLWHAAGGAGIFCFHDENFLMPRPTETLARMTELRRWLNEYGVGKVALVGKCRPESLTLDLARELRDFGVIRLYVGIENASQNCADHLNRRTRTESLHSALAACQTAGIFPCYNLLLFEPGAKLQDIEDNVAFMREHATVPVNFCRAEPYHGTPLYEQLKAKKGLGGSFLGWDYRLDDDRTELLFRICAAVFRERNFDAHGVTNRSMGLGYAARVLEFFHDHGTGRSAALMRRATELTRTMTLEKCDLLDEAIRLAKHTELGDRDRIEKETALLGLRIAAGNKIWHRELDQVLGDMAAFGEGAWQPLRRRAPNRCLLQAMQAVAIVGSLSVAASACGGKTETGVEQVVDGGKDAAKDTSGSEIGPYDALPYDAGTDIPTYDPLPMDAGEEDSSGPYDPLPYDAGDEDSMGPYDALPYDAGDEPAVPDYVPPDAALDPSLTDKTGPEQRVAARPAPVERWRDTSPRRAKRSEDLPLYHPPVIALSGQRQGDQICVTLQSGNEPVGTRWQGDGEIAGDGNSVVWTPASGDDQIRVAVRTRGGIAVASLRVADVDGRKG